MSDDVALQRMPSGLPTPPPSPPLVNGLVHRRNHNENALESQPKPRVAAAYPFIYSPTTLERDVGQLGDKEESIFDPLLLADRLHPSDGLQRQKSKQLKEFYHRQNTRIKNLLKPLPTHVQEAADTAEEHRRGITFAIRTSLFVNCMLAVLQIYAAISSLSLSFFASAIDAIFDPVVTIMLFLLGRKAARVDPRRWPAGGERLISVGIVAYSGIMACASVILIVQSIVEMADHKSDDLSKFHLPATIAVAISLGSKIALFAYCFTLRSFNPQVRILYEDHRNDMVLNAFALFANASGAKIKWWIDPMGAIIISVGLIYLWGGSCLEELKKLAGIAAPDDFRELVIYKAMTFSPAIAQIDTCRVYHSGTNYVIELDIVMPPDTQLWKAHDISQVLQDQLEAMPSVARAYVHIDHESDHQVEHRKWI